MILPDFDKIESAKSSENEFILISEQMESLTAQDLIEWAKETYGSSVALASSFGLEDVVIIDMMHKIIGSPTRIFTLDTGRLNQETYDVMEKIEKKYNTKIDYFFPNRDEIETIMREKGPNLMYESIENRKMCCNFRKVKPLKRALKELKCWITGLRREQTFTRSEINKIEIDVSNRNITKINPLADWTTDQVKNYVKTNQIPYNKLHDLGYQSIGCAPCTRAVSPGEDQRSGRWWWENNSSKECGLHWDPVKKSNKE